MNLEKEQAYWDEWDEAALRRIIQQQRKITEASKKLEMKKLYQVLIICDDMADMPQLHKPNGALDTLFIRGRHMQISTWVSSQTLRLISAAVRVNMLLEAAQPARAGRRCRGAERTAAEGAAVPVIRAGDPGTLQLPVRVLPEAEERNVLQRFEERFALEEDADGSGAQLPGLEAVRQLHADQHEV